MGGENLVRQATQVVLDRLESSSARPLPNVNEGFKDSTWSHDSKLILRLPLYASVLSLAIVLSQWSVSIARKKRQDFDSGSKQVGRDPNERTIFVFRLIRLILFVTITGLSIYTGYASNQVSSADWLYSGVVQTYAYLTFLSILSLPYTIEALSSIRTHLTLVALLTWTVFAYRDLWPLATYTLQPADSSEDPLIWAKIALLTIAAIIIPLTIPRSFTPRDPNKPINPEQTASILSAACFGWLTPYIWLGNKVEHLAWDQLPPLAEYDYTEDLVRRGMKHIDPLLVSKKRHLFFGLIRVFWKDWVVIIIVLIIEVVASLALPIGIFRLLNYLSGDRTDFIRPWFWILWMAVGPIIGSIAVQWYRFTNTRVIVLSQALLIQAIFNHALRSRVKADTDTDQHSHQDTSSKPSGANFAGKLNNLITTDMINIIDGVGFLYPILYLPLQLALCSWFLYTILGWSAFMGMSIIFITVPIPTQLVRLIRNAQVAKMKKTDGRVQLVTEIMNVIRMIKLFAWESYMNEKLVKKREDELKYQRRAKFLELIYSSINFAIPVFTMIVTFASYTLIMKQELTASRVFSAMSVFDVLRSSLEMILGLIPTLVRAKVSLDRANDFFSHTELLDQYTANDDHHASAEANIDPEVIGIRQGSFSWDSEDHTPGDGQRNFKLRIANEVKFRRGVINLIMGPTGSGKTSLLMALLGEMHYTPTGLNSYVQLPRDGGVAYAAQESWVLNATIKDNIVFGAPFDEARYDAVLDHCALKRDLELFEAGDMTEVGEKGVTLSGGQKARVTLARAVYSKAEIVLLDDVLAALDVHTSKWVVDRCLKGNLLSGRTVLLATHNIRLVQPIVEFAVSLGKDGCIAAQGDISSVLSEVGRQVDEEQTIDEDIIPEEEDISTDETPSTSVSNVAVKLSSNGKLIVAEEISRGRVRWPAIKLYLASMGGQSPILYWITFLSGVFLVRFIQSVQVWYLGYWAEQYEQHDPSDVNPLKYLTVYSLMLISGVVLYFAAYTIFVYGCLRASRTIHERLVLSVLGTTLRWLDITPISRIITRCTQDISTIDGPITFYLTRIVELTISMVIKFTAVVVVSPMFIIPGILLSILGAWCGHIYLKPQLAVKREMSIARAPVLSHFSAAFSGLVSIRAYGAENNFRVESYGKLNRNTRTARTSFNINRWVSLRIEVLAGLFAAGLAAYLVYGGGASAANAGFSLTMAVGFNGLILWWVRMWSEFEVSANSLERIQQYLTIEQEPKKTDEGVPPAYWPSSGELIVRNLVARYSSTGPDVLHNVSFSVKAGERIGVVGRTGSGKSSLTLALLRSIITEGSILYDGVAIDSINLDLLRSSITIIPQSPELLTGTLRENLDPFSQYDDAMLNDALRASGLFSVQHVGENNEISLDTRIASGGGNLSTGQRQIIALARALVRQSKLLILDEATSAIDDETDGIIQASLRNELGKDVTLLTVAHRLRTVMDADKILVLDSGSVVEFDTPGQLMRRETSAFKALVNESRDRTALYAMLKD